MDAITLGLVGGVLVLLGAATAIVQILKRRTDSTIDPAILETFRLRIRTWWLLCTSWPPASSCTRRSRSSCSG